MVPGGIRELLFAPLRRVGVMQEQPGGNNSSNLSWQGLPDLQQQQQLQQQQRLQLQQQLEQYRYLQPQQPQQPQQEAPFLVDVVIPPGMVPGQQLLVHAPDGSSCKATVP